MQDPPPAPSAAAEPAAERDEAREARETLKKEWDEAIKKTKPKDTAAGLKSGIATAAAGVASGFVGLFAAPIVGAKQDGASGFAKGLATGIAGAVVLPVAGVVGGAVQVGRGIANQSEAIREKKAGKIWNKETHEWEDPPGTDIQAYDPQAAAARLGVPGEVDYYALLEVSRDADAATIKRQYYILARKWHPDKNPDNAEATERFQQLGQAYQVLSNAELRAKYDKYGSAGLDVEFADPSMIFGMLFGSELFEPIVGEFLIAAATSKGRELTEKEINHMQETRIAKLLVSLKTRLAPYMAGEEEAFREVQGINSEQLAAASFGSVMLQTVGRVYQTEADIYQGNALLGGLGKLRRAGHSIRSQLQAAKAAVDLAQHQAKIEAAEAALKDHAQALQDKHGSGEDLPELAKQELAAMMLQRHELEMAGIGLALQAMWAANVLDIQKTLHQVCKRLLKEPGISKQEGRQRAQALSELGRIYCEAQAPPELQQSQEQHMEQALKKLQDLYAGVVPGEDEQESAAAAGAGAGGGGAYAAPRPGQGQAYSSSNSTAGSSRQAGHAS